MRTAKSIAQTLDGLRIGRLGINKCTAASDVWLTVYDVFDDEEQLSFEPNKLIAFCHEVLAKVGEE